jgi:chaperonin GroEL
LGTARGVTCDKAQTTLYNPSDSDTIKERLSFLNDFITDNELLGEQETENITGRMSRLEGGLAIVHPGGTTKVEIQESRDRLEDAVCAVKAALESGYVPGGGVALLRASNCLQDLKKEGKNSVDWNFGVEVV